MIETQSQIAILEKEIANPVKQQSPSVPQADSAAGLIQQQMEDYQHRSRILRRMRKRLRR